MASRRSSKLRVNQEPRAPANPNGSESVQPHNSLPASSSSAGPLAFPQQSMTNSIPGAITNGESNTSRRADIGSYGSEALQHRRDLSPRPPESGMQLSDTIRGAGGAFPSQIFYPPVFSISSDSSDSEEGRYRDIRQYDDNNGLDNHQPQSIPTNRENSRGDQTNTQRRQTQNSHRQQNEDPERPQSQTRRRQHNGYSHGRQNNHGRRPLSDNDSRTQP